MLWFALSKEYTVLIKVKKYDFFSQYLVSIGYCTVMEFVIWSFRKGTALYLLGFFTLVYLRIETVPGVGFDMLNLEG